MDHALKFTPEQRSRIEAILRSTGDNLAKLRRESWLAGAAEVRKMNLQIEALITPEQRTKFAAFQTEQAKRMHRQQAERDQHGRPGRPDEPPAPDEAPPGGPPPGGEPPPPPPPPN